MRDEKIQILTALILATLSGASILVFVITVCQETPSPPRKFLPLLVCGTEEAWCGGSKQGVLQNAEAHVAFLDGDGDNPVRFGRLERFDQLQLTAPALPRPPDRVAGPVTPVDPVLIHS